MPAPFAVALAFAVPGLFAPALVAQITVGPAGSGASYSQVSAALAVAQPGDTILVAPGLYEPFELTTGVNVIGAGGELCTVAIPSGSANGAIAITGVPAGQTARLVGFGVAGTTTSPAARLDIAQCAGRVEVVDFVSWFLVYPVQPFVDHAIVEITACAAVLLDGCRVRGHGAPSATPWMGGSQAIVVSDSSLWINRCELVGGYGSEQVGASALEVFAGSFVHIARSRLEGGSGGAHVGFYWWDIYCFAGGAAVQVSNSEIVIAGGTGNHIEGGYGVNMMPYDMSDGGSAVRLWHNSALRHAADAVLLKGPAGDGSVLGGPLNSNGSTGTTIVAEVVRRPTLAAVPSIAQPGGVIDVQSSGDQSGVQFLFGALEGIAPQLLPGSQHVHIDVLQSVLLPLQVLDANGDGSLLLLVPASPALAGARLVLQCIDSDLATIRVSNPALLVVAQ